MLCARCNSENADGARFCNACGSPLGASPSSAPDRPLGSALTPRAAKELDAPTPHGEFRQTAIQTDPAALPTEAAPAEHDSISTKPRPLYVKHIPTSKPGTVAIPAAAPSAKPWQWGLAIASAALFLYNSGIVMSITLFWLKNGAKVFGLSTPLVVSLALAGAACCGIALGLSDTKTTLTVIAGGVLMRSLVGLLPSAAFSPEWLLVSGLAGGVLWWLWLQSPRSRGDAGRMSQALTVLVAAEALSALYVFATHPSAIRARSLATVAVTIGALLFLRVWLPGAVGDGTGRSGR
jgi:hypothetical protein